MLRKFSEHGHVSALIVTVGPGDLHEGVQPMDERVKLGWLQSQPGSRGGTVNYQIQSDKPREPPPVYAGFS